MAFSQEREGKLQESSNKPGHDKGLATGKQEGAGVLLNPTGRRPHTPRQQGTSGLHPETHCHQPQGCLQAAGSRGPSRLGGKCTEG